MTARRAVPWDARKAPAVTVPLALAQALIPFLALTLAACGPSNPERKSAPWPGNIPASEAADSLAPTSRADTLSPSPDIAGRASAKVRLRLHNHSDSLALEEVTVRLPHDSAYFAFIRPGGYSAYFTADSAYRYAFIQAKSGAKEYFCQPMDFTDETLLTPGRYTYDLTQVVNRDPDAKVGFFLLELIDENGHP